MKNHYAFLILGLALTAGCVTSSRTTTSVQLPKGDSNAGKKTFAELQCHACHRVAGHTFAGPYATPPVPVVLGAEDPKPNRWELVDSIINPSHKMAPGFQRELTQSGQLSRMGDYSDALTVRQLSDVVAFLESLHIPQ